MEKKENTRNIMQVKEVFIRVKGLNLAMLKCCGHTSVFVLRNTAGVGF